MWRLSYILPLVVPFVQLILLLTLFKYEPIDFSIKMNENEDAKKLVKLIYEPRKKTRNESIWDDFVTARKRELLSKQESAVELSFKEALFGKQYWKPTWISLGALTCAQFTAIGPVTIFSATILQILKEKGSFALEIKYGVMIILIIGAVTAYLGSFPAKYFGRV